MNTIPRSEHPKPQFHRDSWMNLNGLWAFEIDNGRSGKARGLSAADAQLSGQILVPFCPQSELSGVNHKDFMRWRVVSAAPLTLPTGRGFPAGVVFVHFGAVDYRLRGYASTASASEPIAGGYTFPSAMDVTEAVAARARTSSPSAPRTTTREPAAAHRGKQSELNYASHGCLTTPAPPASGRRCGWSSFRRLISKRSRSSPTWRPAPLTWKPAEGRGHAYGRKPPMKDGPWARPA